MKAVMEQDMAAMQRFAADQEVISVGVCLFVSCGVL